MRISDWSSDVCSSDLFRTLVRDLYPVMLDHLNLEDAIGQLAEQWQSTQGIECEVRLRGPMPALSMDAKVHLYRMVQEALTNVARHARATRVCLHLCGNHNGLRLLLRDDGHRSEEHTSELQSLMRISYAGFCLKK